MIALLAVLLVSSAWWAYRRDTAPSCGLCGNRNRRELVRTGPARYICTTCPTFDITEEF